MKSLLTICLLLFVSYSLGKPVEDEVELFGLDPDRLPINVVVYEDTQQITLQCSVLFANESHAVQWWELAWSTTGSLISDNDVVVNHPQRDRYTIIHDSPEQYDLRISPIVMEDGGTYACIDTQATVVDKRQHGIQLTVVSRTPNCTSTVKENGVVIEGTYQSNDCVLDFNGGLIPNMTWAGVGPFNQGVVITDTSIWSGMAFNATREMNETAHQCTTYFTDYFLPVDGNSADNVPDFIDVHVSRTLHVQWGPQNTVADPIKPTYEPGDVLNCSTDAYPAPSFQWQNMRTLEFFNSSTFVVDEAWRGYNQSMRCQAWNDIEGTIYSQNIFINLYVAPITTPTTTTEPTTTTTPPPVAACSDLTGAWESFSPTVAAVCIKLNVSNSGALTGLLRNASDTYWVDIVGRAQSTKFDQVGFNGIWPVNIGVSSFIGECHRCDGVEELLVNVVSRSKGSPCGTPGPVYYTTQYLFRRSTELQCPNLPTSRLGGIGGSIMSR